MASVRIPEQKIILCGEYGVGKSSLFRRFATNSFVTATDRQSTLGLDHYDRSFAVGEKNIKLQLWDTGGMERVASVTSSYYKFAEAALLVFALDNPASFHSLSQHMLDVVTYAENAKIFLVGNKVDMEQTGNPEVTEADMESFCEQCHSLISATYKTSCRTGEGIEEMFQDIANTLVDSNRSRLELQALDSHGFKIEPPEEIGEPSCLC
ncbi:GTP-binding protein YPTC4 [Culex quinquefasciatus]|uniref:GTP-binding protein YPTC4 n=1 Tax=Culex quinquefasciatus TaxID=7176 RepID=B0WYG1_CULQU|nr:ras-related protein Rab-14 [Culex quinquefasciatus]XP_039428912.1 ras-related protein Rab-14-like [Culex pipiens pallens]EDS37038.1 GTP-binding protein YPTC4 [Culex quinquefasciatus]|eukprot:XP_001862433.1 GTP-binding protein YPTC4 [Culex quinquefasciatus]